MTVLTGTHKTKCIICGEKDNLVMRYNGKSMVDLCHACVLIGAGVATKNTMLFMIDYTLTCHELNPQCIYGSAFSSDCIERFEEAVWMGFLKSWIKENRKVF